MKLIDQTPLQDENGAIGFFQRIQGTLKYGMSWYPELEAQKTVLARLQRGLAKGYVAIRNYTLGASGIVVPISLFGPAGVYAIYVTHLRGQYQAKGDSWGTLSGNTFKPAPINLLTRTNLIARALQAYIERQGVTLPQLVAPILITANPGMHVDSVRPLVRVVMEDAVERWAASLGKGAPILTVETAYELADRVINPRKPKPEGEAESPQPEQIHQVAEEVEPYQADADFAAQGEAKAFDSDDLGFAYEDENIFEEEAPQNIVESGSQKATAQTSNAKKRYLGMTVPQLAILGGMFLILICIMIAFAVLIAQNP